MRRQWARWIGDALEPTEAERARVAEGLPPAVIARIVAATEPTEAEVRSVRDRLQDPVPRRIPVGVFGGAVAAAGVAAAVLVVAAQDSVGPEDPAVYGPVPVAVGVPLVGGGETAIALGPSIDLRADGRYVVVAAGETGTEVRLLDGRVHVEVDPEGRYRSLTVRADDVAVSVIGTVFDVTYDGEAVGVAVERGRVAVRWAGGETFLSAGGAWSRPVAVVAEVPATPGAMAPERGGDPPAGEGAGVPEGPETADDAAVAPGPVVPEEGEPGVARPSLAGAAAEYTALVGLTGRAVAGRVPPEAAIEALEAFIARYPTSAEAAEAEATRLTLLPAVDPTAAIREMDRWLADHPTHARAPRIRYERARVTHEHLDRCDRALRLYRDIVEQEMDVYRGRAAAGAGLCAARLGNRRQARRYLRLALDAGIDGPLRDRVERALAGVE